MLLGPSRHLCGAILHEIGAKTIGGQTRSCPPIVLTSFGVILTSFCPRWVPVGPLLGPVGHLFGTILHEIGMKTIGGQTRSCPPIVLTSFGIILISFCPRWGARWASFEARWVVGTFPIRSNSFSCWYYLPQKVLAIIIRPTVGFYKRRSIKSC